MASCIPLTEEEVYDIFRTIFHNEEDALAATVRYSMATQLVGKMIMTYEAQ